jgi:hypothetical protein
MIEVVVAALLAVIAYVLQNAVFAPIQEQRRLIGEAAFAGVFYANIGVPLTPEDALKKDEASEQIRKLASQLRSTLVTIPKYELWEGVGLVCKRDAIMKASTGLIGFSNSFGDNHSKEVHLKTIREALNIDWE